jgi:XTP/dITP diphosphohydrolase
VKQLLLATRNRNKKQELQELLKGLPVQILTLDDFPGLPEVEEDGSTFSENAAKKARVNAAWSGVVCLADDSGLIVEALNGQPGVYSARFSGLHADDESNNRKLLQMMEELEGDDRRARFACVIAIAAPEGKTVTVEGSCPGSIIREPRGRGGFGYDPLFVPEGFSRTFAELTPAQKNSISHRARALHQARPLIEEILSL